jgi:hypothetical protein
LIGYPNATHFILFTSFQQTELVVLLEAAEMWKTMKLLTVLLVIFIAPPPLLPPNHMEE